MKPSLKLALHKKQFLVILYPKNGQKMETKIRKIFLTGWSGKSRSDRPVTGIGCNTDLGL